MAGQKSSFEGKGEPLKTGERWRGLERERI